jgi:hypothetical protein
MTDFDYKKYSLENLEKWLDDALSSGDATPQEIYDVIQKVVSEHYYHHKHHASRAYELMEKLNGNGKEHLNKYEERLNSLLEENNNLTCSTDDLSVECQDSWNEFWGSYVSEDGDIYTSTPNKWVLPVQLDGLSGECYIELPDDLLEVAGLKEGDQVEWIDRKDGSFEMRKVNGTK